MHDVAFVATSTDTCKAALSENTRIQCAPVVVNAAGSSLAMMAEPDDFGETVMYDTGCVISAVFNRETHTQKKLAGRAGDIAPPDNIHIDAAEGSSMGYSGNSWEEFTYGGQTFKVVGAVCDNYHGVTIVGNVTCHKLKALADWEAHTLTFRSMYATPCRNSSDPQWIDECTLQGALDCLGIVIRSWTRSGDSGGITAQQLSKDKNTDWRPRDRVHSTVAHSSAQHQHRRKSG